MTGTSRKTYNNVHKAGINGRLTIKVHAPIVFPELPALLQSIRTNSEAQFTPFARSTLE